MIGKPYDCYLHNLYGLQIYAYVRKCFRVCCAYMRVCASTWAGQIASQSLQAMQRSSPEGYLVWHHDKNCEDSIESAEPWMNQALFHIFKVHFQAFPAPAAAENYISIYSTYCI